MNPLLCFIRARLRRRLFLWFGATILFTGLAVGAVMNVTGHRNGYRRELERAGSFIAGRFAEAWNDPARLDALAESTSRELDVTVIVEDANGRRIVEAGAEPEVGCFKVPLKKPSASGSVKICAARYAPAPERAIFPLFVTCVLLWAASSAIAWRLSKPLGELARVAQALGSGDFSARVKLGRHHHGEAAALAITINEMAERIERYMKEQRELFAAVSHELRTPLARVRLLTEMARAKGGDEKHLDELDREVEEMDALVGDLLASSRLDFAVLSKRRLDAAETAARALERAGADPSILVLDGEPAATGEIDAKVEADATLLNRALANLIDNAAKHGGGVEALRVRRTNGTVSFEVEDKGSGFPEGEETRIFEPFYRRSEQGSLGLGLALVKRIAEAHGGGAFAENRETGGARVGIRLPAYVTTAV